MLEVADLVVVTAGKSVPYLIVVKIRSYNLPVCYAFSYDQSKGNMTAGSYNRNFYSISHRRMANCRLVLCDIWSKYDLDHRSVNFLGKLLIVVNAIHFKSEISQALNVLLVGMHEAKTSSLI